MNFEFSEEQTMVRDTLARLIRDEYSFDARHKAIASDSGWRPEFWAQLAELGILSAPFSEDDGGFGGGPVETLVIMEEIGKGLVVEPFVPSVVCGGGFLKHAGTQAQKDEHLAAIIDGSRVFAFAHGEPKGRYDMAYLETGAKKDGGDYVLNGYKSVVIGAPWASHFIVTARTSGDIAAHDGISVFIVAKDAEGVSCRDYGTVDGRRASEVTFENVKLAADALIGEEGGSCDLVIQVADEAAAAVCAEACGAMKVANDMTIDYTRQRKQFGVPISKFQVLQHRMADMFMEYEQSVSMSYLATLKLGEDTATRGKSVSAAKVRIGQAAKFIGQNAVQTFGGIGVTDEVAISHYFKRLTMLDTDFGDTAHHMRRHVALNRRG